MGINPNEIQRGAWVSRGRQNSNQDIFFKEKKSIFNERNKRAHCYIYQNYNCNHIIFLEKQGFKLQLFH